MEKTSWHFTANELTLLSWDIRDGQDRQPEQLQKDMIAAMKAKDKPRRKNIRMADFLICNGTVFYMDKTISV